MSALEDLAKDCGSLRYARDLIESSGQVRTRPWWHVSESVLDSATVTAKSVAERIYNETIGKKHGIQV